MDPGTRARLATMVAALARFARWVLRGPRPSGLVPRTWPRRLASILSRAAVAFVLASVLSVGALRWIRPVTSAFILRERVLGEQPVEHGWTAWDAIAPRLPLAVVASEDQRFPEHHGFDLEQIQLALSDGRGRGASTISQQVAKNLYLWPGGGFFRKGVEAWFTVLIETLWPKRRILEVYLNIAEFGPGIFGVDVAASRYFGKEPASLTATEAARLAAVLPSPKRMSVAQPSSYVIARTAEIVRQMELLGAAYLADL